MHLIMVVTYSAPIQPFSHVSVSIFLARAYGLKKLWVQGVRTDQADDALVADPVFQEADQPILADATKRRGDRLPITGIFPIR